MKQRTLRAQRKAARRAARRRKKKKTKSAAELERAYRANDLNSFVWANVDFYDRNTQLARNRTVKRILDSLLLRTLSLRRLSLSQSGRMQQSFDDHSRLVKAYEGRDHKLAAALMHSNHINALAALEAGLALRGAGGKGAPRRAFVQRLAEAAMHTGGVTAARVAPSRLTCIPRRTPLMDVTCRLRGA